MKWMIDTSLVRFRGHASTVPSSTPPSLRCCAQLLIAAYFLPLVHLISYLFRSVNIFSNQSIKASFFSFFLLFSFLGITEASFAQSESKILVESIRFSGNERTKEQTILMEMTFRQGDSLLLSTLTKTLEKNEQFLLGTSLFQSAKIKVLDLTGISVSLEVEVKESWYLIPVPIFELADRNFNVWWTEMNHDFRRTNYGVRVTHSNLTGRKDYMKINLHAGYMQKVEFDYLLPGIFGNGKSGLGINVLFSRNKEIAYQTFENKLNFEYTPEDFLFFRQRYGLSYQYRPHRALYLESNVKYHYYETDQIIQDLNSTYFGEGASSQTFLSFGLSATWDTRDFKPYPSKGFKIKLDLTKEGIGVFEELDQFPLQLSLDKFFGRGKWNLVLGAKGKIDLQANNNPPYYNYRALGFLDDYLRGYELYVVDGRQFVFQKSSLRYELFDGWFTFPLPKAFEDFSRYPMQFHLSLNNDIGYVSGSQFLESNDLTNTTLWGYGLGVDFLFNNSILFQVEYSFNQLNEKGVFLHIKVNQ